MEIIPAVIPQSKKDLLDHIERVHRIVPIMQIDVCDGRFVSSVSWPYISVAGKGAGASSGAKAQAHAKSVAAIDEELAAFIEDGLPHWEDLDYEIDMMVEDPVHEIERWIAVGAKRLVVHVKSLQKDGTSLIDGLNIFFSTLEKEHGYVDAKHFDFFELGIALEMDTPVESIAPFIDRFHFIQLMGIDTIGLQGQVFDERVLDRVAEAKKLFPDVPVSVDGGVSLDTAAELADAGADRLVVGSAIFKSLSIADAVNAFKMI